jgi:drug/metabolite transporter (DMT)-like permease
LDRMALFSGLTRTTLFLGLGIGLFEGIGQMCNYEAFKRIDGYLAHMMFNFSVLITFAIETFLLQSVHPTLLLLVSFALIVGASVGAELINSRAQRRGL